MSNSLGGPEVSWQPKECAAHDSGGAYEGSVTHPLQSAGGLKNLQHTQGRQRAQLFRDAGDGGVDKRQLLWTCHKLCAYHAMCRLFGA